ncbi:hypothetical protein JZ751_017168, partial [Albula glossodonta]
MSITTEGTQILQMYVMMTCVMLISLQKASGSWDMGAELAELCGKTTEETAKHMPAQADRSVWATVLALLWLYGFKLDYKEEWQFVAMKAVSWIRAQTAVPSTLPASKAVDP